MARVELTAGPAPTRFSLKLDGREVGDVVRYSLHADIDELATFSVDVLAHERLDLDVDAKVDLKLVALPGYDITWETAEGRTRVRVVPPDAWDLLDGAVRTRVNALNEHAMLSLRNEIAAALGIRRAEP